MNTPQKTLNSKKTISQQNLDEREIWYKLVVKVIKWSDNASNKSMVPDYAKITPKEWKTYCTEKIRINAITEKSEVMKKLRETEEIIIANGGFEQY